MEHLQEGEPAVIGGHEAVGGSTHSGPHYPLGPEEITKPADVVQCWFSLILSHA